MRACPFYVVYVFDRSFEGRAEGVKKVPGPGGILLGRGLSGPPMASALSG